MNLNLISKDKFQKMGFKNKSTAIAFIKTVLLTNVNRFNTIEQLAQHVKPKINKMKDLGVDRAWDNIRNTRDSKISEIEWRYNRFHRNERLSLLQVDSIAALDEYIQALADITNQSDPYNIVWPSLSVV